ncbi:MAG TPA: tripartite tricarboxylate transporter substrate binding protein [Roseomonas sp.]
MVALARTKPGTLTFGSSGVGASNQLAPELLRGILGINWIHVPYRGSGPAITDLIGGRIDVFFDNLPSILPQIRAGTVRPIAAISNERIPELPDVPTFRESGLPGLEIDSWFDFLAPTATPESTVVALNAAFNKALEDPTVRQRLREAAVVPLGGPPSRMADHLTQGGRPLGQGDPHQPHQRRIGSRPVVQGHAPSHHPPLGTHQGQRNSAPPSATASSTLSATPHEWPNSSLDGSEGNAAAASPRSQSAHRAPRHQAGPAAAITGTGGARRPKPPSPSSA